MQYEYKRMVMVSPMPSFVDQINKLGAEGWKIIHISDLDVWLMREFQNPTAYAARNPTGPV